MCMCGPHIHKNTCVVATGLGMNLEESVLSLCCGFQGSNSGHQAWPLLTGLRPYISNKSLGDKVLWFGSRANKQTERKGCKQQKSTYNSRDPCGKPRLSTKAHSKGHPYMEGRGKSPISTRHKLNSGGLQSHKDRRRLGSFLKGMELRGFATIR